MAKNSVAKSTVEDATVENATVIIADTADKKMSGNKNSKKKSINVDSLEDSDEIEVVSLIPNVSYKDNKTGDIYEWDEVGHSEYMTFDTLKNMWRSHKGYFRNLWLKPNDDRVVVKFGLTKVFEKHEFLMDDSNYVKKNIDVICDAISSAPNGLKYAICNKIKDLVVGGKITDISVIRALEKHLKIELIELI